MVQQVAHTQFGELQIAEGVIEALRGKELTTPGIQHLKMVAGVGVAGST